MTNPEYPPLLSLAPWLNLAKPRVGLHVALAWQMALRQVSDAEKVGWSDAKSQKLGCRLPCPCLPPDAPSLVVAVNSPREQSAASRRASVGPCNMSFRKLCSQEPSCLVRQQTTVALCSSEATGPDILIAGGASLLGLCLASVGGRVGPH